MKKNFEIVEQRSNNDCGICCLAMITGKTYEETLEKLNERAKKNLEAGFGLFYGDEIEFLWASNLEPEWTVLSHGYMPSGKKCILSVPSKNFPTRLHAVYFDGTDLHDPSTLIKYKKEEVFLNAVFVTEV